MLFNRGRRHQIIINSRFQFRYALTGVLYIAIVTTCLSISFLPLRRTMQALLENEPAFIADMVNRQQHYALLAFILYAFSITAAWMAFALIRSHRIAGAAYRLKTFMDGVTLKNLQDRVTLRSGDDLQEVAEALTDMLERIEQGTSSMHVTPDHAEERPEHIEEKPKPEYVLQN